MCVFFFLIKQPGGGFCFKPTAVCTFKPRRVQRVHVSVKAARYDRSAADPTTVETVCVCVYLQ